MPLHVHDGVVIAPVLWFVYVPFIVIPVVALTVAVPVGFRIPLASIVIDAQVALALTVTVLPFPMFTISPVVGDNVAAEPA